jgi:O-antigen/teichoic acid export membrane protein
MNDTSIDAMESPVPVSLPLVTEVPDQHGHGKLRRNIAALSVLQLLNYALPLAVVPYLVRILGPAHYGLLVFSQATVNYANSVIDYGFNYSATRLVARHRSDRDALSRIFWSTIFAKSILLVASFIVIAILLTVVPMFRANALLIMACTGVLIGNVLFPMWFFQGMEEMRAITIAQAAAKLLVVPMVFLFVTDQSQVVRAAAIQSATYILAGLIGIPLLLRVSHVRWFLPSWKNIIDSFREGWHVFISTAAIIIYTSTNTVLLGFLSGDTQVGYFGAADRIIKASQGVTGPITQALYPHLNAMVLKSRTAALALIRKSMLWIVAITLSASLAFFFGADLISHIALGRKFDGSIAPLRWMAFIPLLLGLSNVFGVQTMLTFGMNKEFNRIVTGSAILNLLLTIPFARMWGASGAAAAILVTEIVVTAAMFLQVRSLGFLSAASPSSEQTE